MNGYPMTALVPLAEKKPTFPQIDFEGMPEYDELLLATGPSETHEAHDKRAIHAFDNIWNRSENSECKTRSSGTTVPRGPRLTDIRCCCSGTCRSTPNILAQNIWPSGPRFRESRNEDAGAQANHRIEGEWTVMTVAYLPYSLVFWSTLNGVY